MAQVNDKFVMDAKHVEDPEMMNYKNAGLVAPIGDYSGAVAKTDLEEIALVRKLDLRIMPTLWCMYFMNYVSCETPMIYKTRLMDEQARQECNCECPT